MYDFQTFPLPVLKADYIAHCDSPNSSPYWAVAGGQDLREKCLPLKEQIPIQHHQIKTRTKRNYILPHTKYFLKIFELE